MGSGVGYLLYIYIYHKWFFLLLLLGICGSLGIDRCQRVETGVMVLRTPKSGARSTVLFWFTLIRLTALIRIVGLLWLLIHTLGLDTFASIVRLNAIQSSSSPSSDITQLSYRRSHRLSIESSYQPVVYGGLLLVERARCGEVCQRVPEA